jgi:hypothetical protein
MIAQCPMPSTCPDPAEMPYATRYDCSLTSREIDLSSSLSGAQALKEIPERRKPSRSFQPRNPQCANVHTRCSADSMTPQAENSPVGREKEVVGLQIDKGRNRRSSSRSRSLGPIPSVRTDGRFSAAGRGELRVM